MSKLPIHPDNKYEIDKLEKGIIQVYHGLGEEAALAVCVGELKPFGDAVVVYEKIKAGK